MTCLRVSSREKDGNERILKPAVFDCYMTHCHTKSSGRCLTGMKACLESNLALESNRGLFVDVASVFLQLLGHNLQVPRGTAMGLHDGTCEDSPERKEKKSSQDLKLRPKGLVHVVTLAETERCRLLTHMELLTMEAEYVAEYKEARAKLVTFLKDQARLIRNQPNSTSVREAQTNLRESGVELLDDLARAALMVSCEALDHPFVTAKPFGFYNDHVVNQCILLEGALLVLSNGL